MEKWKAKYASHFPTPSTAERYRQNSLRYTNYPTGTKDRARQYQHGGVFFLSPEAGPDWKLSPGFNQAPSALPKRV